MAVQHLRLVCGSLAALTLLVLSQIRGQGTAAVPSLQQLFVLNSVLSIAVCSLLFCSTGFAIAGWLLLHRTPKSVRAGLHFSDSPPSKAELQQQERSSALQTLAAANWACSAAYVGLFYALSSLRWALPSLPAWGTIAAVTLCATNLCTGGALAAKHSRWAPWLLPGSGAIPLNEPCRIVAFVEHLRARVFGKRPGLPRPRSCGPRRAMRRSASWDSMLGSPPEGSPNMQPGSSQGWRSLEVVVSDSDDCSSAVASSACSASSTLSASSALSVGGRPVVLGPAADFPAQWAQLDEASFHTPPRGITRTYSEDDEVDTSDPSSASPSLDGDGSRMFLDALQANIMTHPDDTLQFLARLSPERSPKLCSKPLRQQSADCGLPSPAALKQAVQQLQLPTKAQAQQQWQQQHAERQQRSQQQREEAGRCSPPGTPPQEPHHLRASTWSHPESPRQVVASPQLDMSLSRLSFGERKQHLTRVSATVDELLDAIVGELV